MADVGRVRIAGSSGEKFVQLSEDVEKVVPALTSSLCISTGGVNIQNALRTVTAYEANHMERQALLGPMYKRTMSPMTQSKILYVVRQLLERLAPRDMKRAMSPLDALAGLAGQPNVDELVYKLLIQVARRDADRHGRRVRDRRVGHRRRAVGQPRRAGAAARQADHRSRRSGVRQAEGDRPRRGLAGPALSRASPASSSRPRRASTSPAC